MVTPYVIADHREGWELARQIQEQLELQACTAGLARVDLHDYRMTCGSGGVDDGPLNSFGRFPEGNSFIFHEVTSCRTLLDFPPPYGGCAFLPFMDNR